VWSGSREGMGRARWDFIGVVFKEEDVREEERRGWGGGAEVA
jgi:hypothetical protein